MSRLSGIDSLPGPLVRKLGLQRERRVRRWRSVPATGRGFSAGHSKIKHFLQQTEENPVRKGQDVDSASASSRVERVGHRSNLVECQTSLLSSRITSERAESNLTSNFLRQHGKDLSMQIFSKFTTGSVNGKHQIDITA